MARDIPKVYEPQEIERRWAQAWFDDKLYRAESSHPGEIFSIALPPPNVTGSIHIGHMFEHTQIDILVRWRRMQGRRTLWLPGIDHAGIATQVVVERQLAKEGLKREEMGRDEFERRVWKWKAESGGNIKKQMIRLGVSCDWTRERFTLDPPMYRAVMESFLRLYREGLIYRGRYMVNWCPRCKTALSDLEVVHEPREGKLWYIRYPIAGSREFIVVATTRPETMLGDTAVAVHPADERYKSLIGKKAILPLMNREIPIIADEIVDREFGTGAVKVTPAHDPNDFAMGQRHKLAEIEVIDADARMAPAAGPYAGLDRFAAREKIVEDLKSQGLLERITNYSLSAAICDRCKTIVEPRLSVQWFCKMQPLAEPAIQVVCDGLISVVPENQKKIFLDWLTNIRDWCISRQLWWGHRIPIWHCADCGAMTPARDSRVEIVHGHAQIASVPEKCAMCGGSKLAQDPDVLDTWFSSALWPFSTLGWPDDTEDLRTYFPTSLMISGYDILFFWDARMVMMGLHLMPARRGELGDKFEQCIPFRQLYVHGIVRDPHGIKMSKTRGNVVDPLEVIEKYGTDALRFTLSVMAAPGSDIALSEERILSYRAFANKIWNAARFLFFNLEKIEAAGVTLDELAAPDIRAKAPYATRDSLAHRWIFSRLAAVSVEMNDAFENFRFHEAAHVIYHFFWGDFCDWYIEWLKPQLNSPDREDAIATWRNLFAVFEHALRLLHPFMPFLTEELWHKLPQRTDAKSIALEPFPKATPSWNDSEAVENFAQLQEIIIAARNLRAELKIEQKKSVPAYLSVSDAGLKTLVETNAPTIHLLANLSDLRLASRAKFPDGLQVRSAPSFDLGIVFKQTADLGAEIVKLKKEKDRIEKDLASKRQRLADQTFRSRAPAEIVRGLEATLAQREIEYQKTLDRLAQLEK